MFCWLKKEWAEKTQRAETEQRREPIAFFSLCLKHPMVSWVFLRWSFAITLQPTESTCQHLPLCFIHLWVSSTKLGSYSEKPPANTSPWRKDPALGPWHEGNALLPGRAPSLWQKGTSVRLFQTREKLREVWGLQLLGREGGGLETEWRGRWESQPGQPPHGLRSAIFTLCLEGEEFILEDRGAERQGWLLPFEWEQFCFCFCLYYFYLFIHFY